LEPSESREPSYYEVALTNRQVLVAFVALLTCMLAAFLSGVWIGRGGASSSPPPAVAQAPAPNEPQLEQLTFFTGKEPGARTATAVATPPPAAPRPAPTTAAPPPAIETATPAPAPAVAPTPKPTAAKPAPTPAPAAARPAAATGKIFVQVYSSTNGARAREIVAQLKKGGFKVQLNETPKSGGQTSYRVRVGPYDSRSAADTAAGRLRREYRLDTWVTDTP
jgi:DedD protein